MTSAGLGDHRAHDAALLARRWFALARRAGLSWNRIGSAGASPVHCAGSRSRPGDTRPAIYLSAGIHGDEPAAPWGLLEWAEDNITRLRGLRVLIFPCLNPEGLRANTRVDQRGIDLNRRFHDLREPLVAAWRCALDSIPLAIALCLHEDYDAQGCYVYELTRRPSSVGADILRDCSRIIPPDGRRRIDGRAARDGVIVRRVPPELPGLPEAIALHNLGAPLTLTFESPSEHSLLDRIAVQKTFIESALRHEGLV